MADATMSIPGVRAGHADNGARLAAEARRDVYILGLFDAAEPVGGGGARVAGSLAENDGVGVDYPSRGDEGAVAGDCRIGEAHG